MKEVPSRLASRALRIRAGCAIALCLTLPCGGRAQDRDEREQERARDLHAEVQEKLRRGRLRTLDVLLALRNDEMASKEAARAARAVMATGDAAAIAAAVPVMQAIADAPQSSDVEVAIERVEALATAGPAWQAPLERSLRYLFVLQSKAGGFAGSSEERDRPDDATITARALLAARAASLAGLQAPPEDVARAVDYLLERQLRDGGVGGPGRRAKSNGAATAAAIAAWTWAGSTCEDAKRLDALQQALQRAEAWLQEEWTVERNPGSNSEGIAWLVDLERAEQLALIAPETAKRRVKRRDGYLAGYQLPDWGWNHRAGLQDVMGPAGSLPSGAGAGAGTGPGRLPRGVGALPQVTWDPYDTASATLALAAPTRVSEAEMRFSLQRRLSSAKTLPAMDRFDEFVALLRENFALAVPELIAVLSAPEAARRNFALRCLQDLTGEDFGFEAGRSPSDDRNRAALDAWREWWMTEGRKRK